MGYMLVMATAKCEKIPFLAPLGHVQHPVLVLGMRRPAVSLDRRLGSCISHREVLMEGCRHQEEVMASAWVSAAAKKPLSPECGKCMK